MKKLNVRSSYIQNDYGKLFQALISAMKPNTCVEIGVLDGYSTIKIGLTLKTIGMGHLYAYDLFEDYPYTNQSYQEVFSRIERLEISNEITLRKMDIENAASEFEISSIDLLHVDISNSGEKISNVLDLWNEKIKPGGILIFEGGSPLRDEINWMNELNKEKIFPELKVNKILNSNYTYVVFHPYPSIVVCSKNIDNIKDNWIEFGYHEAQIGKSEISISENTLTDKI